ncbi:MAG: WG repeat-containing protein, partial [Flavobacteriales bacterium]|nr:WG repeat-containing protein [Flavobacteriales bacterium]
MKYDVFISYSTKDKKVVEGLCAYLEQHKIRCFVAYRDVDKTAVWAEKIVEGLEESRMMLVVFSENYNCSDQVNREIEIASEDKKPILTFRLTDTKFKGAKKFYLKNLNWIDAFPHPEESFGSVTNDIARLLGIKIPPITREEQSNAGGGIAPIPTPVPKKKHKHTLGIALFSIVGIALLCFIIYFNEWGNKGEEKPDVPDVALVNDSINKPVEDVSIPTNVVVEKLSSQKAEKIDTAPVKAVTTEQQKLTATKAVSTPVKAVTTEQQKPTATKAVSTPVKAVTTELKKTSTTKAVSTPVKEEKATVYYKDKYDYVSGFFEGLAVVEKGEKKGYIDKTGREVVPCIYDDAWNFSEGLAYVRKDGKYGYIDKTGKEIASYKYDYVYDFS